MVLATGARAALAALCAATSLVAIAPSGVFAAGDVAPPARWVAAPAAAPEYSWPLAPPHAVLRPFQPPATRFGPGHRGVDLDGSVGSPVYAAGDGMVLYAGRINDRTLVSVEHSGGLRTTYEPIVPGVQVGQQVLRGELIGHLQAGHAPCGVAFDGLRACLHWGARMGDVYLDPLRLVGVGSVRLLPWDPG
jgi:murein DD-endopeptidase MepM/ murein hydrolase activator NlpD